jgi:GTP cyclohydrolase I
MSLIWGDLFLSEGMQETPERIVRFWLEATEGLNDDPSLPLQKQFSCPHDEIVLIKDISFQSLCEHHFLPFVGKAHIAYIPNGKVVGLSKMPRCLDILAARPQIQERLTVELGQIIERELSPLGTMIVLEAEHICMNCRGVLKHDSVTKTSYISGLFKENASAKLEVLEMLR